MFPRDLKAGGDRLTDVAACRGRRLLSPSGCADATPSTFCRSPLVQRVLRTCSRTEVRLSASGVTWTGRAIPITDPAEVHKVVEKFRERYGAAEVKKYYSKFDVAVKVSLR